MTSTYSPDLRLELMATGDQSGTWGVTTNVNLGTLLEQAICGVLSVSEGDTTLTLTANNGASDQARNAVVILTGAMTAQHNVIVPTVNKSYIFKNLTTGGFAVNVKTSGGTGTLVAAGQSRSVYCDGTNVVSGLVGYRTESFTTTVTAAATTTLDATSFAVQEFTGTTTQIVALPVVSTLFVGKTYTIINQSTGAVTVNSSGSNLVATVPAKSSVELVCALITGTSAASWDVTAVSSTGSAGVLPIALGGTGSATGAFTVVRTTTYTSSTTWTPNANLLYAIIQLVGGGGGGGGVPSCSGQGGGGGGGAGAYSIVNVSKATAGASQTVTIGAAGAGGAAGANSGSAGGATSVGAFITAGGGAGGGAAPSGNNAGASGPGGAAGAGDVTSVGQAGGVGMTSTITTIAVSQAVGGSGPWGGAAAAATPPVVATGATGTGNGAGGNGGVSFGGGSAAGGGNGSAGKVLIYEFCSA